MSLTRRCFSAFSFGACLAPSFARAQVNGAPTVIELFTSQGCSSCPAADALMVELSMQPGMIPLTYPVEIWDYLGWKDTLAQPAFTRRQKAYAAMVAGKRVYTPQAIVNGRAHCVGSDGSAISRLKNTTANPSSSRITLARTGEGWSAQVSNLSGQKGLRLVLLPFTSRETVKIGRGENSGRTVTYANVVRDIIDFGPVDGAERRVEITRRDISVDKADGFALILQAGGLEAPGAVLAGAMIGPNGVRA